jgi:hypothetical protein
MATNSTRGNTTDNQPPDPPPPPPKLYAFALVSVGVASIVFIIETLFKLFTCGCKC